MNQKRVYTTINKIFVNNLKNKSYITFELTSDIVLTFTY